LVCRWSTDGQRIRTLLPPKFRDLPAVADSQTELTEKAHRTVARITSALDRGDSASIVQIVELIREVTCKLESISVQQLGEAVGRDLLTMSRVISVAHTLGYNPEGVEISTINQAIQVIGFNKIRNRALSLMLLNNAASANPGDKRDVAASALVSGLVAQTIRERINPHDAEDAFVCTALRNDGRIMLANFLPDEYQEAVSRSGRGESESKSFREHFDLTTLEPSVELLGRSRMPRNLMLSLGEVTPAMRKSDTMSTEQELSVRATFADELCQLMHQPSPTVENFSESALHLLQSFGPNIPLSEDELFDTLIQVSNILKTFGGLHADNALNCPLLNRLSSIALERVRMEDSNSRDGLMNIGDTDVADGISGRHHDDALAASGGRFPADDFASGSGRDRNDHRGLRITGRQQAHCAHHPLVAATPVVETTH